MPPSLTARMPVPLREHPLRLRMPKAQHAARERTASA